MKKITMILTATLTITSMVLPVCSFADENTDSVTNESAVDEKEDDMLIIGEKPEEKVTESTTESTENATESTTTETKEPCVYHILWTNKTGHDITGVQIKNIYKGSYPDNIMKEDEMFKDGETAELYFDASEEDENAEFNVRITFEDGTEKDMTSYPFSDMTEATLYFDDDVLHAVYVSLEKNEEKDTYEREKALRNIAENAKTSETNNDYDSWNDDNYDYGGNNSGGATECIGEDADLW